MNAIDTYTPAPRPRLEARPHVAPGGVPYYDEELDVAQNEAHRIMVSESSAILAALTQELGLLYMSDQPIWYLHPENDTQRVFYGDCVIAKMIEHYKAIADDLLLVFEVVTTHDRRKELKDTHFQRLLNEYNGVPEFALIFPDEDDARALTWFRLDNGVYMEHAVAPGGSVLSESVPGLELRVLPRAEWERGYKIDFYYQGELRPRLAQERARAEQERARAEQEHARAEQERARAEQERARAEQERARADKLAARLRELGIDPEG